MTGSNLLQKTAKQLHDEAMAAGLSSRPILIFAVYDKKSLAYGNPTFFHQKGQALRVFADAVNDEKSPFFKHPEDFALFHLGEWNELTGVITPLPNPVPLEEALSCVNKK